MAVDRAMNAPGAGWEASLELEFGRRRGRSHLTGRRQRGPLAVQRCFYPEGDPCHTYVLHPPGGVVGGDRLDVRVGVTDQAHALLTTPGATKFYRSAGATALQYQRLAASPGSTLEWMPQENIYFPEARACLDTHVVLAEDARHFGWEIHCLGRPVIDEAFIPGHLDLRLRIDRNRHPVLRDRLLIESPRDLASPSGLRANPVVATAWMSAAVPQLEDEIRSIDGGPLYGCTRLDDLLVVRVLGTDVEKTRHLLVDTWRAYRKYVLQRPACPPRIWST